MVHALLAALFLGIVSTAGDFVWANWRVSHRVLYGLAHGAAICLCIGAVIGARARQLMSGAAIGPIVGLFAAGAFYLLAPMLRYSAMFPAWMLFWICFAVLQAYLSAGRDYRAALVRGVIAALLSGMAFYLVSGMWTSPPRGGPNYPMNLLSWTFAFLPGFVALFFRTSEPTRPTG